MGPTGRGRGSCPDKDKTVTSRVMRGRGRSQGQGSNRGSGFRRQGRKGNFAMGFDRNFNFSKQDEKLFLEEDIKSIEEQLVLMKNRLDELGE